MLLRSLAHSVTPRIYARSMSTLTHLNQAINKLTPLSLAETSWDNVGLMIEAPKPRQLTKRSITVCIDRNYSLFFFPSELPSLSLSVLRITHRSIFYSHSTRSRSSLVQPLNLPDPHISSPNLFRFKIPHPRKLDSKISTRMLSVRCISLHDSHCRRQLGGRCKRFHGEWVAESCGDEIGERGIS